MGACTSEGDFQTPFDVAMDHVPGPITVAISVCKVATDAATVGQSFTFNTSAAVGTVTSPVQATAKPLGTHTPADCPVVWSRPGVSWDNTTNVTITEVLPADYHLDLISFTGTGNHTLPAAIPNPASPSVTVRALDGLNVYFKNSFQPRGEQGCTPGYWKTHSSDAPGNQGNAWPPTGYTSGQLVSSVFTVPGSLSAIGGATLLQALDFPGGPGVDGAARNLMRAAVAALLNAAHPGVAYPRTTGQIITSVNAALASLNRSTMLTLAGQLDTDNNLGCPLN